MLDQRNGIVLNQLTATEALARLRAGSISVEELAKACLDRVADRDRELRVWSAIEPTQVLAAARGLDKAPLDAPLRGIPIGVKDVIDTVDLPTQYNSPIYQGRRPSADAAAVAILRQAGALIFGKTDTVEFAAGGRKALSRNPLDVARTPGGSSSGSAAAVADFHVPIALGTQSAGSVIRPASYCGVFAMKPTWGAVSREGIKHYAVSLDTLGWFARSVADLRLIADVLAVSIDPKPVGRELAGARIALCRTPAWLEAEQATIDAMAEAARLLRAARAEIVELDLPAEFDGLIAARRAIGNGEGRAAFLAEERLYGDRLHKDVRAMARNAASLDASTLRRAYDLAASSRAIFDEMASGFDAVLAPSAPGEAPIGLERTGEPVFNEMWTLLHVPCVTVPGFRGPSGLPVGVTLTGPRFADYQVLALAEQAATCFSAAL